MAQRPIWKGHLRLALVSCPVALYTAKHDRNAIRFNMINPKTGNRVKMLTVDSETEEELSRRDTIKGYEYQKGHYVTFTDEDFESVKVESSTMMSVEKFVTADSIDPVYYDTSYFLGPDGHSGRDVYAVLRDAIAKTGRVALARVVISQRERTIAIRPTAEGLVAQTLYEDRDLNSAADAYDGVTELGSDPEMVQLAVQLIDRQTGKYDPADVEDKYEIRLRAMIDAKLAGKGVEPKREEVPESNVIDLMAALKKSLGAPVAKAEANSEPAAKEKKSAKADLRQTGLKLPIEGGKPAKEKAALAEQPAAKSRRKAS
jgi:DNA end-binding protein Ku